MRGLERLEMSAEILNEWLHILHRIIGLAGDWVACCLAHRPSNVVHVVPSGAWIRTRSPLMFLVGTMPM